MKGVILAGGSSTRMGRDKALVQVAGMPMIELVQQALGEAGLEVAVVGREDPHVEEASHDLWLSMGPLSGLATALTEWGSCVMVAVDQPLLRPETARSLAEALTDRPVVPIAGGARQVTCAAYPAEWAGVASEELAGGGSIQSLLDREPFTAVEEGVWSAWGEDGRSWFSADTTADVAFADRVLRGEEHYPKTTP